MRKIMNHIVPGEPNLMRLSAEDDPDMGGVSRRYVISGFDTSSNPSGEHTAYCQENYSKQVILFQHGPVKKVGINGVTQEVLLAILIDRLTHFQAGELACKEDKDALEHLHKAMEALHRRTVNRLALDKNGTNKP